MPDGLYERDILVWSEQQAELLRRIAAGERLNAMVDWANVIEEIECVGRSEFRACRSAVVQALVHLLKLQAWPDSLSAGHWRGEVVAFMSEASQDWSPSMRQRVSVADLYADALRRVRAKVDDSGQPRPLVTTCPFSLDDLLDPDPNPAALLARLAEASKPVE